MATEIPETTSPTEAEFADIDGTQVIRLFLCREWDQQPTDAPRPIVANCPTHDELTPVIYVVSWEES